MKGNIVTAAKLFSVSLILSALIVAFGINLAVALQRSRPVETPTTTEPTCCAPLDLSPFFKLPLTATNLEKREDRPLVEDENQQQRTIRDLGFWVLTNPSPLTFEPATGANEPSEADEDVVPIQCPKPDETADPQRTSLGFPIFFWQQYSSNPNDRMQQLLIESENLRKLSPEQRRAWLLQTPGSQMEP
jgi:hypothetical protein